MLVGLMLAVHYTGKATIAQAWRLHAFSLSPTARALLNLPEPGDERAQLALSRRFYRAFDRLTSLTDPARADRRRRLPACQAAPLQAAWEDDDPEHLRRRQLLRTVATALVLAPVRHAVARKYLHLWNGDIGVDTTAIACQARPPRDATPRRPDLASIEITAGWHHSAGSKPATFGYSATLTVAAARRNSGRRPHPQLALGLVLDTPSKRVGPNAIIALADLQPLGLPAGLLAADRAYTDQTHDHFARDARILGYRLVLDYKRHQRGVQTSVHGSPLIDGNPSCPLIPAAPAHATTGLDDQAVRNPDQALRDQIAAREPYYLKLKQAPDARGAFRVQCPAAGTSPSLVCPRFNRLHPHATAVGGRPTPIDLTDPRQRAAHTAAKPTVIIPAEELLRPPPPAQLPCICRQQTITIHPDDLGDAKLRQELHYLTGPWEDAYKPIRAHNERLNGRLKGHSIDISDPKNRLAHGRTAQTILVALMSMIANLQILTAWRRTRQPPGPIPDTTTRPPAGQPAGKPSQRGRPPPTNR